MKGRAIKLISRHAPKENVIQIAFKLLGIDGGPGSGNFGHAGRPGQVGGSAKGSGGGVYRTQASNGKYVGIQRSKAFKSIAKQARTSKDVKSFVDGLSKEQYDMFVEQFRASGTKEKIWDYTQRVYDLMRKQKPDKVPEHKVVEGKDISGNWNELHGSKYTDPATGQVIDYDIEDAMYRQGFLGLPKVVSQEEFDKIVKDNPNMPLLYRSYTGATPEQVQDFDDQLESGEWYVDCENGGAGFGQGMYCAGVYPQEPLYRWDDPKLDDDFDMGRADAVVFTDSKGNGYVTKEKIDPESADDLYAGIPYLVVDEYGKRHMIRMDDDAYIWTDVNTGELLDDDRANEIVMRAKEMYECKDQDLGIYADAYTKDREKGIKGALEEMKHYRSVSTHRVMNETIPEPPEGKELASKGDQHYYYDMKDMVAFEDKKPQEGDIIAIMNPRNMRDFEKYGASLWAVRNGVLVDSLTPGERGMFVLTFDEVEPYEQWAKVEGECDPPILKPTSSTRLMTLDPSAKIITYNELRNIKNKAFDIRSEFKDQKERELGDYLSGLSFDDAWCESKLYYASMGEGIGNLTHEQVKKVSDYRKSHPERMEKLQQFVNKQLEAEKAMRKEAAKYDHLHYLDEGVVATLLGYDAINAEGHGESGSYTVVLNRTKLIISNQRVDMRK